MGALILDASALIAVLDDLDAHHASAVDQLEAADAAGRALVAPASAYSEALVAFARAKQLELGRSGVAGLGVEVAPLTAGLAESAAALRARHKRLRLPDALVLACARELGGSILTFDRRLAAAAAAR